MVPCGEGGVGIERSQKRQETRKITAQSFEGGGWKAQRLAETLGKT